MFNMAYCNLTHCSNFWEQWYVLQYLGTIQYFPVLSPDHCCKIVLIYHKNLIKIKLIWKRTINILWIFVSLMIFGFLVSWHECPFIGTMEGILNFPSYSQSSCLGTQANQLYLKGVLLVNFWLSFLRHECPLILWMSDTFKEGYWSSSLLPLSLLGNTGTPTLPKRGPFCWFFYFLFSECPLIYLFLILLSRDSDPPP